MDPYRGPEAPPTLPISATLTARKTAPRSLASSPSRRCRAALNPRFMLVPWSPSPMAASSLVRYDACTSTTAALRRTQAPAWSAVNTPLRSPAQPGRVDRGVPQPRLLVVQPQDRHRAALHLQGGDVRPDQVPGHPHAALVQQPGHVPVDHVQLGQRRPAHRVDEQQRLLALVEAEVLDDRPGEAVDQLVGRLQLDPLPAGLAVDADADLDLVVAELEGGLPGRRHRAGGERQAHGADVGVDVTRQRGHRGQVPALLGPGPGDLLHQHGAADPAAALRVQRVPDGHVVVDHHALHLDAGVAAEVGRHLEVHHVAGVVLDDVQHPGAAVDLLGRPLHLVGGGGGEHLPGTGRVEHAHADEAAVHRLVPRPAAGDHPDLALPRRVGAVDHERVVVDADQVAVGPLHAFERLADEVVDAVDELLHLDSLTRTELLDPAAGAFDGLPPVGVAGLALVLRPLRLEGAVDLPVLAHLVQGRPVADGQPGQVGGAQRGGLLHLRPDDGDAEDVGLQLHEEVVLDAAAVHPQVGQGLAGVLGDRLGHVAALVALRLQGGADQVRAVDVAGQADDRAAGAFVPVGG